MASSVATKKLAAEVMRGLTEYATLATNDMKKSVKRAARTVQKEIKGNAPKRTGKYAASWRIKTERETATSLNLIVHSKKHYRRAHLLEDGHAKRGGGRVSAQPHIAPAEQVGVKKLEAEIKKALGG